MKEIVAEINGLLDAIKIDIVKEGNKAAAARVRKNLIALEKIGKAYRKESIAAAK